jgi:hypothetical protein
VNKRGPKRPAKIASGKPASRTVTRSQTDATTPAQTIATRPTGPTPPRVMSDLRQSLAIARAAHQCRPQAPAPDGRAINSGEERLTTDSAGTDKPQIGPHTASAAQIPKLMVRVRFSSPAPTPESPVQLSVQANRLGRTASAHGGPRSRRRLLVRSTVGCTGEPAHPSCRPRHRHRVA